MARYVAWVFAALLLVPATGSAEGLCDKGQNQAKPGSAAGQPGSKPDQGHQPPKWWVEPNLRAELGITDQQSAAIEAIWKKDLQQRTDTRKRLETLEAQLDQMMVDASLDETAFLAQLEKVEAARIEASKWRMLMLYRMNKVLTPDQRVKLAAKAKAMRDQKPGGGDRRDR
jgi:Spy/CpxP family protein refolding chaperone